MSALRPGYGEASAWYRGGCDADEGINRPVRTFDTAVVYYHKFRLVHSDGEYAFAVCTVLHSELLCLLLTSEP